MSNMSFFATQEQIRNRNKTVTRRIGWSRLKAGDVIDACEKVQGLGKGGKVVKLCQIMVVSTRWEPLNHITQEDVVREGFPDLSPQEFVNKFCGINKEKKCQPDTLVNRIEFVYRYEVSGKQKHGACFTKKYWAPSATLLTDELTSLSWIEYFSVKPCNGVYRDHAKYWGDSWNDWERWGKTLAGSR